MFDKTNKKQIDMMLIILLLYAVYFFKYKIVQPCDERSQFLPGCGHD